MIESVFAGGCVKEVLWNLYVFSPYRNPDLYDCAFDHLLTSMAAVQAEDVRASFLFAGDFNGHHPEWLGSNTKNCHGLR